MINTIMADVRIFLGGSVINATYCRLLKYCMHNDVWKYLCFVFSLITIST